MFIRRRPATESTTETHRYGETNRRSRAGAATTLGISPRIGISPSIPQQLHDLDVVLLRRYADWGHTVWPSLMRWYGGIGGVVVFEGMR